MKSTNNNLRAVALPGLGMQRESKTQSPKTLAPCDHDECGLLKCRQPKRCFSLCRQLERELNDSQKALEAATDKVARLQALYDCMDPKGFFARKIEAILGQNTDYPDSR